MTDLVKIAIGDQIVEMTREEAQLPPLPTQEEQLAAARAKAELPRFDFAMATAAAGIVTYEVAAQWAAGNQVPTAVQAVIDAMPAEQQGAAVVDVLARPVIRRSGSMMPALAAAYGLSEADLDALFGINA